MLKQQGCCRGGARCARLLPNIIEQGCRVLMRQALAQVQGFLKGLNCGVAGCSRCARWHRCKGQQGRLQRGNAAMVNMCTC